MTSEEDMQSKTIFVKILGKTHKDQAKSRVPTYTTL